MSGSQYSGSGALRNPDLERVLGINLDGASDRPRGSTAGSQRGSVTGSHSGSRAGSRAGSPPRPPMHGSPAAASSKASGYKVEPLGYDPAREKPMRPVEIVGKRVDLPADAYLEVSSCPNIS